MNKIRKRHVVPAESLFSLSPFAVVALVFKIKGKINHQDMHDAVNRVRRKHPLLNSVISIDSEGRKFFEYTEKSEIDIETLTRETEDQWMKEYHKQCLIPFEFDRKPSIRFILISSPNESEIMIFCHHIICDGLSLAFLGRAILEHLGRSEKINDNIIETTPVGKGNLPEELKINWLMKKVVDKLNGRFINEKTLFDFKDYKDLHEAYWKRFTHKMIPIILSKDETAKIIERCKENQISVNSVVTTAINGAKSIVLGKQSCNAQTIPVSIRNRLPNDPGEGMGFFAGSLNFSFKYNQKKGLWDNAIRFQRIMKKKLNNKAIFHNLLKWSILEPGILESINYKLLGYLVKPEANKKVHNYSGQKDVVYKLMQRGKMKSLSSVVMGTGVTNLGNLSIEKSYGDLKIDSVIMNPGGAIPLAMAQLISSVLTASGKMSILLEYEKTHFDEEQINRLKKKLISLLT